MLCEDRQRAGQSVRQPPVEGPCLPMGPLLDAAGAEGEQARPGRACRQLRLRAELKRAKMSAACRLSGCYSASGMNLGKQIVLNCSPEGPPAPCAARHAVLVVCADSYGSHCCKCQSKVTSADQTQVGSASGCSPKQTRARQAGAPPLQQPQSRFHAAAAPATLPPPLRRHRSFHPRSWLSPMF